MHGLGLKSRFVAVEANDIEERLKKEPYEFKEVVQDLAGATSAR